MSNKVKLTLQACLMAVLLSACLLTACSGKTDKEADPDAGRPGNDVDVTAEDQGQQDDDAGKEEEKGEYTVQIHVSVNGDDKTGDGSKETPYATIATAVRQIIPGTEVIVHEGEYEPFEMGAAASGTSNAPVCVRAAEGEKVVIRTDDGKTDDKKSGRKKKKESGDRIGIHMVNVAHITLEGFEVTGGTHGIYYESTRDQGEYALDGVTIRGCTVHGVRGTHGICVYARNDLAPVTNLKMEDCEVYDCECGDSESTVFNGNVDGFEICGNQIHDNNNIGIDMIGFEGTARHPKDYNPGGKKKANRYEVDFVRNGKCHDNTVYNISAEGNEAYLEDGEYDLCADGIYVDGGQDIEIYNNFIFNCDIGLEVATEHSPDDNELFKVSGVEVHDNVIANCTGWCGICFGGYDKDLGFTENCIFRNNTLVDNDTQIGIQRSRDNRIVRNLMVGGTTAIEFNEDIRKKDRVNYFEDNASQGYKEKHSWTGEYGRAFVDRETLLEDFKSRFDEIGSEFVPGEEATEIYNMWKKASLK